jgi:hypothetical protein
MVARHRPLSLSMSSPTSPLRLPCTIITRLPSSLDTHGHNPSIYMTKRQRQYQMREGGTRWLAARVADPDTNWIRIQSGRWFRIRIRIQEGKNDPQEWKKKNQKFHVLKCYLLRAEGFFCISDVLYGGLGIGKL